MERFDLDFMWPTEDPFLFCVFHNDRYPKGNRQLGPAESLAGRSIGQDFQAKNGYRMYHGQQVPGFPTHPHRGFETITVVERGFVDHSDSLGAAGRYGQGDVQWMTAGKGLQHSEMFPLVHQDEDNPLELFQIWLNLPAAHKMVEPHFKMLWSEKIPTVTLADAGSHIKVIAGRFGDTNALPPPPDSWAANPDGEVGIFLIDLAPEGALELSEAQPGLRRRLYLFTGASIDINGDCLKHRQGCRLDHTKALLKNSDQPARALLLQGQPINEPVVQHGPFVMNHRQEIIQAIEDYQSTQFGGWPWSSPEQVHGLGKRRFARYPDGREEYPEFDNSEG